MLLITWGFGGLIEAMAGFGTAVAIPAAILIGLGFKPIFASVVRLLANTVPTVFGAIGVPVIVLGTETEMSADMLGANVVLQLGALNFYLLLLFLFSRTRLKKLYPKMHYSD